uniref:DUF4005 domain-containing protein n=1 Tax=Davidia involucrata TaxID=16924 RepID=A0A5B7AZJ8_DAVIN
MGKTSKWIRNFFTGKKKDTEKNTSNQPTSNATENPTTPISIPPTTPKEKRRWSFRRSSATATGLKNSGDTIHATTPPAVQPVLESENEQKQHAMAVAAAQAAAAVIRLTAAAAAGRSSAVEEAAAIKIQSVFRSYLARKALCALKGLVKLQALVRGHLVRKQATATFRCMQALVTAQARARAQRIRMAEESKPNNQNQLNHRKTTQDNWFTSSYHEMDRGMEENIKIVEMDLGESKGSRKIESNNPQAEPALADMSPRACSGHFEDYSSAFGKEQSRVHFGFREAESLYNEYPFFPNYMANTESWRAKVRSQSAPKQRPADSLERQPSKRRASVPPPLRMQRSSSHVGSTAQNYQFPCSNKLDRSTVSFKDSECGSNTSVLTNTNYSCWL